ncbi:MAG: hypothetical protein ACRC63_00680, partial [Metamycoplasmataceae bacterium]
MQLKLNETSTNISKLLRQVKKEHFIKLALHISTVVLLTFCLFILIFSTTSFDTGFYEEGGTIFLPSVETGEMVEVKAPLDANSLYVANRRHSNIFSLLAILGGSGWITFLFYLSIVKNMITPQFLKKTLRQGIAFGYTKQKDVDYMCDEIDYNIGIKERPK